MTTEYDTISFPKTLHTVWDPDTTDICAELEKGGYKAEIAGDDFPRLVNAARALLERRIRGLVISGESGAGKTLAASILARGILSIPTYGAGAKPMAPARIECGNINFSTADELHAFATHSGGPRNWWIEDMGVESPVNEFGMKYDPVASFFYNLPPQESAPDWCPLYVLVTTNLSLEQIAGRYGDRTASRLCDHFGWLRFDHGDVRHNSRVKF